MGGRELQNCIYVQTLPFSLASVSLRHSKPLLFLFPCLDRPSLQRPPLQSVSTSFSTPILSTPSRSLALNTPALYLYLFVFLLFSLSLSHSLWSECSGSSQTNSLNPDVRDRKRQVRHERACERACMHAWCGQVALQLMPELLVMRTHTHTHPEPPAHIGMLSDVRMFFWDMNMGHTAVPGHWRMEL